VRRAVPLLAVAALAGCAPRLAGPPVPRERRAEVAGARFQVVYWPEDEAAAEQVVRALDAAVARTARWGGLAAPVTITIHPTHEALEAAVRRPGFDWLRAWARYGRVDVQSPRTWRFLGASEAEVAELVTHELAHCVMYQRGSDEFGWASRGEPLWFREGLASVTAEQGYRRGTLEDLWRFYRTGGAVEAGPPAPGDEAGGAAGADPIVNPEALYRRRSGVVYDAAHHAFAFLLDRYGEARVRRVLALTAGGATFPDAFREAIGIDEDAFAADFRRYVVLQGWRR
jgi:hypothetical protein